MSYTGKSPDFDAITIKDEAGTPSNPQEGQIKLFIQDGKLYQIDKDGKVEQVANIASMRLMSMFLN